MAGARSGCKSVILREAPKAIYVHCAAHRLNLAVFSACKLRAFKNVVSYIGEISKFSPKRQRLLDKAIDIECASKKLKDACRTRWIEHIDSYTVFLELIPAVYTTLLAIVNPSDFQNLGVNWNWDGETITKATGYVYQLESSSFLVCFKILIEVLSQFRGLTLKLQMQAADIIYAYGEISNIIEMLLRVRQESEKGFKTILFDAR